MNVLFSSDSNNFNNTRKNIDIFIFNGNGNIEPYIDTDIDVCIFEKSNINNLYKLKNVHNAVSCGMHENDSVTFSSISEDSAVVCIRRSIVFDNVIAEPCEFKTDFHRDISIFSNLAVAMIDYLSRLKG